MSNLQCASSPHIIITHDSVDEGGDKEVQGADEEAVVLEQPKFVLSVEEEGEEQLRRAPEGRGEEVRNRVLQLISLGQSTTYNESLRPALKYPSLHNVIQVIA